MIQEICSARDHMRTGNYYDAKEAMDTQKKGALFFATHNLMRGVWLDRLVEHYKELRKHEGLDVLCVQENVVEDGIPHIEKICRSMGGRYKGYFFDEFPSTGIIYDSEKMERIDEFSIKLPDQEKYSMLARIVASESRPVQRYAVATRLRVDEGNPVTVVSMHLTAFGGNELRNRQITAIKEELDRRGISERLVVCGDTNLFAWRRDMHKKALKAALKILDVNDPLIDEPTYYFSRIHRRINLSARVPYYLGKVGIDLPRHYDVVASQFPLLKHGKITTPESDHDLVWACYGT